MRTEPNIKEFLVWLAEVTIFTLMIVASVLIGVYLW